MKKGWKSRISLLTVLMLFISMIPSYAANHDLQNVVSETAKYLLSTVQEPKLGSVGGEWAVLGLARSGEPVPKTYFENYYRGLEKEVISKKGILHEQKYTEYSRVVLALSSLGVNPKNVGGYDLLKPLLNVEKGKWQGVNGSIFALLALDASAHWIEKDVAYETAREGYLKDILSKQLADGGWAFSGEKSDPDLTAMALQSLAKYQSNAEVKKATERGLQTLSNLQNEKGGYASWGEENSESVSQTIVALSELGIPLDSKNFVKNGNSLLDNLMTFYVKGQGFKHSPKGEANAMATEQAFYALVAANRVKQNKSSLYRMKDATGFLIIDKQPSEPAPKPPGDSLINVREVVAPGKTFSDIQGSKYKNAIEKLAERGIVSGRGKDEFKPNLKVTRAEFAVIVLNGLGIQPKPASNVFKDVKQNAWYASYVTTAHQLKIVSGVGDNKFNPNGDITIQEAAVMVTNAARLGNLRTNYNAAEIRDILAQFEDYTMAGDWARESLAFCYANGVWSDSALKIRPKEQITRGEVAETVYNLMNKMELIR